MTDTTDLRTYHRRIGAFMVSDIVLEAALAGECGDLFASFMSRCIIIRAELSFPAPWFPAPWPRSSEDCS